MIQEQNKKKRRSKQKTCGSAEIKNNEKARRRYGVGLFSVCTMP